MSRGKGCGSFTIAPIHEPKMRFHPFLATLLVAFAPPTFATYLVVLTDGGFFQVTSAALIDNARLRLHLPEGAWLELPLSRVERVVEMAVPGSEKDEEKKPEENSFAACSPVFASQPLPPGLPYRREMSAAAERHNLDPTLLAAVVAVESGFNPFAVSKMGARGLMQLMPAVWLAYGLSDPHHPASNLDAGAAHLRKLLDRFARVDWALAAYNAGAAVVEAYGGIPPFPETRNYVMQVLTRWCPQETRKGL